MLKKHELTIEWNWGAWLVSAIVGGQLETRRYYGYTKNESAQNFLRELNYMEGN